MGQVLLAKSATTDFDEQERFVGTLELPINGRGQSEISEMVRELAGVSVDAVYAASGASSRQTATLLSKELGVKMRELEDLRNLDFGLWQGLPIAEVQRKHKKLYSKWKEAPCEACPPAGEEVKQVYERVEKIIGPILRKNSFKAIVIIAPDPLRKIIRCYLTAKRVDNVLLNGSDTLVEKIPV